MCVLENKCRCLLFWQAPPLDPLCRSRGGCQKQREYGCICNKNIESNTDLKVVNFLSCKLSPAEVEVLSLGLNFCVVRQFDLFEVVKDKQLFTRNLLLKMLFSKTDDEPVFNPRLFQNFTVNDFRMLRLLNELLEENIRHGEHTENSVGDGTVGTPNLADEKSPQLRNLISYPPNFHQHS